MTELTEETAEEDEAHFLAFLKNVGYYYAHENKMMKQYGGKAVAIYDGKHVLTEENVDDLIIRLKAQFTDNGIDRMYIVQVYKKEELA